MMRTFCLCLFVSCHLLATAQAELTVAALFTNNAIIQRDQSTTIWGTADPAQAVQLTLGKQTAQGTADPQGRWVLRVSAQTASDDSIELRVRAGNETLVRSGILLGDVWHASGQSNMAMNVGSVAKSLSEVRDQLSNYDVPEIRFVRVQGGPSKEPEAKLASHVRWVSCNPKSVRGFSAAAFFFAKRLHDELGVPIGIIDSSRGGTPIEPYIPAQAFTGHPTLERELSLANMGDLEGIWKLPGGVYARDENWLPGRLFNARIAPIQRYAVKGCIWYQGESNCGKREDPRDYQFKMGALIRGWRAELKRPDLPFYFVQLPGSGAGPNWPYLREQQRLCSSGVNVGMVVTIDLEDPDIHPPNKVDVGRRLAGWALAKDGRDIPFSGPTFSKASITADRVIVELSHCDSGLMIAAKTGLGDPRETPEAPIKHFEILGADGEWRPAQAKIVKKHIVVSCIDVTAPVAVRYAYDISPRGCNLFNRDGLPLGPFCSRPDLLVASPNLPR